MATKKQLEEMIRAFVPVLKQMQEFEKQYGDLLREYQDENAIVTDEDRADAAIKMIRKYSNL